MKKVLNLRRKIAEQSELASEPVSGIRWRHNQLKLAVILGAMGLAIVAAAIFWPSGSNKSLTSANPTSSSVPQDNCPAANTITYSCYKNEISEIVKNQGTEAAFAMLKAQYQSVPYIKSQCHQLTHVVGRAAYAKYGNLSDTFTHGDQFCWSGYYHGVMEELSNEEGKNAITNANSICADLRAKEPQSFYHYNCVHGLGHGFMFILNQNLFSSLTACDSLTDSFERVSCYGGVFMQNIMNVQSPDEDAAHASQYLKASEPMYPCTAVDEKYKGQCYLMQTSYALQTVNYDFSKVFTMCGQVEAAYRITCYTSLGRDASGNSISDVQQTKAKCLLGPTDEAQKYCIHGAAVDFVSYFHSDKQAYQLCNSLPVAMQQDCSSTVKNYYAAF